MWLSGRGRWLDELYELDLLLSEVDDLEIEGLLYNLKVFEEIMVL